MASSDTDLPEGTDQTIPGATVTSDADLERRMGIDETPEVDPTDRPAMDWTTTREKLTGAGADIKDQATDRVRAFAVSGKDRAVDGLDSFTKLIDDAADTVDEKVGEQYGAYVRQASQAIGGFATTLREKDVDELFAEARDAVKQSPGVAIGAAAAIGFVLARIVKAGFDAASAPREAGDGPTA